jgi:hypothetical protein
MRTEKGQKVDWAQIIFNSLCNELDWWYKHVKHKRKIRKIHVSLLWYWQKSFGICVSKGESIETTNQG